MPPPPPPKKKIYIDINTYIYILIPFGFCPRYRRFHALGVLQASVGWFDCAARTDGVLVRSGVLGLWWRQFMMSCSAVEGAVSVSDYFEFFV